MVQNNLELAIFDNQQLQRNPPILPCLYSLRWCDDVFSVLALIIPPYLDTSCSGTPPDYQDTSISDALEPHLLVTESLLDLLALELFLAVEVFRGTYASPLLCLARDEAVLLSHTGLVGEAPRRESFQLLLPWYFFLNLNFKLKKNSPGTARALLG